MSDYIFEILSWDESSYHLGDDGSKMSKASISKSYSGKIQGQGQLEYTMSYQADGSAFFVGLERFVGQLDGKQGEFVLQHQGCFSEGEVQSEFYIVKGSGKGELKTIQGKGKFATGHGQTVEFEFDYQLVE